MCNAPRRLRAVRRSDAGRYRCWLRVGAALLPSDVGTLSVHGENERPSRRMADSATRWPHGELQPPLVTEGSVTPLKTVTSIGCVGNSATWWPRGELQDVGNKNPIDDSATWWPHGELQPSLVTEGSAAP